MKLFKKYQLFFSMSLFFLYFSFMGISSAAQNILVFGTSLSDVGYNTWVDLTNKGQGTINNNTIGAPYTNLNTETNRRDIWVDYLARKILLDNQQVYPASKQDGAIITAYSNNISYAYGGADTSNGYLSIEPLTTFSIMDNPLSEEFTYYQKYCTHPDLQDAIDSDNNPIKIACLPGLLKQVELYLADVHQKPNPETVFFIWAGENDILYHINLSALFSALLVKGDIIDPSVIDPSVIDSSVANIVQVKNELIQHGVSASNIYVFNMPNVIRAPDVNDILSLIQDKKIRDELTQLVTKYNQSLVNKLTADNNPLNANHIIDVYQLLEDIATHNKGQYQSITNVTDSCIKHVEDYPSCKGYLFAQGKHPTTAVHQLIADLAYKTIKNSNV